MSDQTAPLDHQLVLPLTHLEFVLLIFLAHTQGYNADEWVRLLLTGAARNELHSALKNELLGRVSGDVTDEDDR